MDCLFLKIDVQLLFWNCPSSSSWEFPLPPSCVRPTFFQESGLYFLENGWMGSEFLRQCMPEKYLYSILMISLYFGWKKGHNCKSFFLFQGLLKALMSLSPYCVGLLFRSLVPFWFLDFSEYDLFLSLWKLLWSSLYPWSSEISLWCFHSLCWVPIGPFNLETNVLQF